MSAFLHSFTQAVFLLVLSQLMGVAHAAQPVRESEYLEIDGARLYTLIRGDDETRPILLWLHGGPGGAERPLFRYYNGELESRFIAVYYDQRGAGRSFDAKADPALLTIDRHLEDLDAVVDYLRKKLGKRQVILAGHSWGGALGLLYAEAHPGKVSALLAIAPLIDARAGQDEQYESVSHEATKREDTKALETIEAAGHPPYDSVENSLAIEHLADRYGFVYHTKPHRMTMMLSGLLRGLATPWEIPKIIRANNVSLAAMKDEIDGLDLTTSVTSLDVPVYFLLGRFDHHVGSDIAAAYSSDLDAPHKEIIWFEESAHNPPFEEPHKFNETVEQLVGRQP
ncbi:MAG: alpha/beta hydrolase [Pseudomonadales bacterium]|nr:alpha/beta hydrolase [Pseudomonadales bacterium]